jgi:hypothetical protein
VTCTPFVSAAYWKDQGGKLFFRERPVPNVLQSSGHIMPTSVYPISAFRRFSTFYRLVFGKEKATARESTYM